MIRHTSIFFAIIAITLLLGSCTSDSTVGDEINFDRQAMLNNYGDNAIVPAYVELRTQVDLLQGSVESFNADPTVTNLEALSQQLKSTRLAWQDVNLFQFGPAESVTLRSALNIYAPDTVQIESNISSGDYQLGTIANQSAAGFPTLGYLVDGLGSSQEKIVSFYTDSAHAEARKTYLLDNLTFVSSGVVTVEEEWASDGGDYIGMFTSEENAGTDVGSSLGMMINAMVQHYERNFRDGKIGIPAGVRSAGVPRPMATEAYYSGYSVELALANLRAIQRVFKGTGLNGSDGVGIEEHLQAMDAGDLADQINMEMNEAISELEALQDPLSEQIRDNNDPVLAAFQEMQDVVTLLKADMTSVLGITITFQDNDGD